MSSELRRDGANLMRLVEDVAAPGIPPTGELLGYTEKIGPETKFFTISPEGFVRTFGALPVISFTAGETIDVGELTALVESGGLTRLMKADADGASTRQTAAGICSVGALAGASAQILTFGQAVVPDAEWDVVPVVGDIGEPVFMSLTPGNITVTAPVSGTIQRVGIVALVGGGSTTVVIQIGQPIRQ